MQKRIAILPLLALIVVLLAGCGLLRAPEEASAPIEAIPLEVATDAAPTQAPASEAGTNDPPDTGGDNLRVYTISQEDSQVRFELDEDLRGRRTTVVGTTDQVAGEIAVNLNDLSTAQIGVLQINARTLVTDNDFRNRAIQNEILDTGSYEFITFTPTAVDGLPANAEIGEEVSFTVTGNLTIRDVTRPVTFNVTATADSDTRLSGSASTTVSRADFDLSIPQVRNVANVEDQVDLIIDFVAGT